MGSKYRAKPTILDGTRFHSIGEANRWAELLLLQRAGVIRDLRRQIRFPLHAMGGVQIGLAIFDFGYRENGVPIVEDFKGVWPALSKWKLRHAEAEYGIKVRITR